MFYGTCRSDVFLIPILTDEAEARTRGKAVTLGYFTEFRNVNRKLEDGKFVEAPRVSHHPIQWVTTGKGVFGGDERVRFEADVGNQRTGIRMEHLFIVLQTKGIIVAMSMYKIRVL